MPGIAARLLALGSALLLFGSLPLHPATAQDQAAADSTAATGDTTKAYIVAESLFVAIDESGRAIMRERRIVRINSADGAQYARFSAVENSFSKIKEVSGFQFDASGNAIDSLQGKKNLVKLCGFGPEFSLYMEDCNYVGGFLTARVPYTVDWQSAVELKSIAMWPGWIPEQKLLNKSGYCQIKAHPANNIHFVPAGEITPVETIADPAGDTRSWSITNLPALEPEPREPWPSRREVRLYVIPEVFKFAGKSFNGGTWNAISKGCYDMTLEAFKSSSAQDDFFKQHQSAAAGTPFAAMHKSLASRLRYVAIYLGMGGWIPHPAKETFQIGYGDCKDLATLYAVMFAKAGVTTRTSLLSTRNEELIDPAMPIISLFNHVIMFYVEDAETTWVDPTCFDCALGDLPYADEGLSTLAIDNGNGNLLTTPTSDFHDNIVCRKIDIDLEPNLEANIKLTSLLLGNPSHGINTLITGGDRNIATRVLAAMLGIAGVPAFDHKDIIVTEKELSRVGLEIGWSNPRMLKAAGEAQILDLAGFRVTTEAETTDLSKRKQTLEIGYPCSLFDTVRVVLPPGYTFKSLPADVNYTSKFGDLSLTSSISADTATFIRSISRKLNCIEPSDFDAFSAHRKEINLQSRAVTTITKKP